jgi:DNA-binding IclR family transcriptional regulator
VGESHRTIGRVAAILEQAAADGGHGVTLTGVARHLGAPKSSVHGLLRGLVDVGYLVERDGRYRVGPALTLLGGAAGHDTIQELARPELLRLARETEETVLLGLPVGTAVVHTDQIESPHPIRYAAPMHVRRPMLTTSMGKLFLAHLDERRIRRIVAAQSDGDVEPDEVLAELAQVRARGYAVNHLAEQGITALAAGVAGADGRLCAGIAVRGPSFRIGDAEVAAYAELLVAAADRVTARLQPPR